MSAEPNLTPDGRSDWTDYDRLADLAAAPLAAKADLVRISTEVSLDLRARWRPILQDATRGRSRPKGLSPRWEQEDSPAHLFLTGFVGEILLYPIMFCIASVLATNRWLMWTLIVLGGAFVVRALIISSCRDRAVARMNNDACPQCSYDLVGLPNGIPYSLVGAATGPRRCPECGEPWPLVPRTYF